MRRRPPPPGAPALTHGRLIRAASSPPRLFAAASIERPSYRRIRRRARRSPTPKTHTIWPHAADDEAAAYRHRPPPCRLLMWLAQSSMHEIVDRSSRR